MAVKEQDQLGMDEIVVEDPALLAALEEREVRRESSGRARRYLEEQHNICLGMIEQLELDEGAIRIGRFRITKSKIPGRTVTFTTTDKDRIRIGTIGEEE